MRTVVALTEYAKGDFFMNAVIINASLMIRTVQKAVVSLSHVNQRQSTSVQINECTENADCDSVCCKDNKCQESSVSCFHLSLPTFNVKVILDACSTPNDCFPTGKGCCVDGHCRSCTQSKYISILTDLILYHETFVVVQSCVSTASLGLV